MKINDILTINDTLKKEIWQGAHGEDINPEVSRNLIQVAQDFFDGLKLEGIVVDDITFTGSLANYNYTKFSDIDLHLLVDFSKVYKVKYPLLYGSLKDIDTITRKYGGIYAVPQSFLIDSNGKIIYKFPGAILKEWDPLTYQKLITGIESEIKIINSN